MTYKLEFLDQALKEWKSLDSTIKEQFRKKLNERLKDPHHIKSRLSGIKNRYKIKSKSSGYRLVYEVIDKEVVVVVIAVANREKDYVYTLSNKRIIK